ncbi:hypothetical protein COLO4_33179 [Corchorus olitorius]|uniref:Uncharacterized protein n=1 Tax=Corchorus olitorius TaxID=93759 RepID=A0A1R3GW35_9ROSI|nr:hypothetical protein COLO4_33179 [Corchorus olitorius]
MRIQFPYVLIVVDIFILIVHNQKKKIKLLQIHFPIKIRSKVLNHLYSQMDGKQGAKKRKTYHRHNKLRKNLGKWLLGKVIGKRKIISPVIPPTPMTTPQSNRSRSNSTPPLDLNHPPQRNPTPLPRSSSAQQLPSKVSNFGLDLRHCFELLVSDQKNGLVY